MKKLFAFLCAMFVSITFAHTINWHVGDQIISTTTCSSGDNITPPTAPAKYGYHFIKWRSLYTRLEYVYMPAAAYLQTALVPTYDCKIEFDFQTTTVPIATATFVGGRSTLTYGEGLQLLSTNSVFAVDAFGVGNESRYLSDITPQNNTRYKFTFNNGIAILESGGSTMFTNIFAGTNTNGAALAINALNNGGGIGGNTAGIYVYSFKMWDNNGNLIANYVPVEKLSPQIAGFYDTVSGTFKTATRGTFVAGPEIND